MNKKELLDGMSIHELQNVIYEKQKEEAMKNMAQRETEFKMNEVDELKADGNGNLFHVVVGDGCEGWEAIVIVDENVLFEGDLEDLVESHIINFIIDNDYYESDEIEDITVNEICRYNKPIFKIHNDGN